MQSKYIYCFLFVEIKNSDRCYIFSYVNNLLLIVILNKILFCISFLIRFLWIFVFTQQWIQETEWRIFDIDVEKDKSDLAWSNWTIR